jgi:two-component sensor histidine kinase
MLVDITERKRAEEQQALLIRELHHRVKNTLATVQAIMGSTARSAESIEEFREALTGRINSLARTHLLLADEVPTVGLGELLRKELGAFDDGTNQRITLAGPAVRLHTQLAVSLGMAAHELTTNAAKYGALSVYGGQIEVTWRVTLEAKRSSLHIDWQERGGPRVSAPERKGFGMRILELVLPGQIQATTHIDFAPDGLQAHFDLPLPLDAAA